MLSKLKSKFTPQKTSTEKTEPQEIKKTCNQCLGKNFWLPKNATEWRCEKCTPPASGFFVADRSGQPASLAVPDSAPLASEDVYKVDQFHVTYCMPWCESCGSWQGVETWWSDGTAETICRICRAEMPARPKNKTTETQGAEQ